MVSKLSKQYYSFHEPEKYQELAAQCEGRRAKALSSNERKYFARQAAIFRQLANRKAPQKTSPTPNEARGSSSQLASTSVASVEDKSRY
jgi:hypothetical protein